MPPAEPTAPTHPTELRAEQTAQLQHYLALLLEQNRAFNLTAITDPSEAWGKHVLDSLSLLPELADVPAGATVVDVGSGGGLPGLPLAIARPDLKVTLLEATGKKAHFLASCASTLQLANVCVENERAESFGHGPARGHFAVVTSRAVSRLPVLLELCVPLLRVGGRMLAIKGEQAARELDEAQRALSLLGTEVVSSRRTETGVVVHLCKRSPTPPRYPRRPGEPKRDPL